MTMQNPCAEEFASRNAILHSATPLKSVLASYFAKIADFLEAREQRRIDRDAFNTMLTLDDDMLADIGVTRDDVYWASRLPLSVNASEALQEAKRFGNG